MKSSLQRRPHKQDGIALFVALIFLVVLTLIGVASLSNNTLQARMTYGAAETNFALQAAETGVSAGEAWLQSQTALPQANCTVNSTPSSDCPQTTSIWPRYGQATPPVSNALLASNAFWTGAGRLFSSTQTIKDFNGAALTTDQPRYVIETNGQDPTSGLGSRTGQSASYRIYFFLVSARGVAAQSNASTVVQTVYAQGF